jgi:pilus assembly protein CpaB
MPRRNLIVLSLAALIGLFAVYLANSWFSGVETRQAKVAEQQKQVRIAVAANQLGFGTPLTGDNVRLVNWPADSVPQGAFTSTEPLMKGHVAVRPMVIGEPVLASKISGLDGRASISNNLPEGMRAVSIPINEVSGVGGFVAPGDIVDVILTRNIPGDGAQDQDKMTNVVLEAVPVLGIDQLADDKKTDPKVAKTATLQVDQFGAQKLVLAQHIGSLSLALRNVANPVMGASSTVTARDLGGANLYIRKRGGAEVAAASAPSIPFRPAAAPRAPGNKFASVIPAGLMGPSMTVVRGTDATQYEVKRYAGW